MIKEIGNMSEEEKIKSIAFTLTILHYQGMSIRDILTQSIKYMRDMYEATSNMGLLDLAEAEILAYISMGFPLTMDENVAYILQNRDIRAQISRYNLGKRIRLNKTQVRGMIGKWKSSQYTPMTIGQVVDDIITKVSQQVPGTWRYIYYKAATGKGSPVRSEEYELVISPEETFFWDINHFKFYTFEGYGG